MGNIIITYKIFPVDITVNFDDLKKKIEGSLPEFATIYGYDEEPIAFGLKALICAIKIPEDKTGVLENLERGFEQISEISQVQPLTVRRVSR
ncbi:MAG: elongation factor 1-beta [Candidatus Bathyarchaeia archaeon]